MTRKFDSILERISAICWFQLLWNEKTMAKSYPIEKKERVLRRLEIYVDGQRWRKDIFWKINEQAKIESWSKAHVNVQAKG